MGVISMPNVSEIKKMLLKRYKKDRPLSVKRSVPVHPKISVNRSMPVHPKIKVTDRAFKRETAEDKRLLRSLIRSINKQGGN